MNILYAAIDQRVPAPLGGAVHVEAVAAGLARRGHDVHVLATPGPGGFPDDGARWYGLTPPLGLRQLRWLRARRVAALASRLGADAVMERYYNFGGEGVRAARLTGALAVLEVNAPILDHPGSIKRLLDRAVIVEPLRRWREWQCRNADLVVTPSARIVPDSLPADRLLITEWGADTDRFRPGAAGEPPFARRTGRVLAVFAGAFRAWHGALALVDAIRALRAAGRPIDAVLIGEGPELARVRRAAAGLDGVFFTGAVPHASMPACLAAADVGVAPFDVGAHPPLGLDFYWSPLKIFEYMAAGLPVVTPNLDRLASIVGDGQEGLLYDAARPGALADALARLLDHDLRARLGAAARARVVAEFSWSRHCERLDEALRSALDRRRAAPRRPPVAGS